MKKVFICGAHSTGKTTLVDYLREKLKVKPGNVMFSEEVARQVLLDNKVTAKTQEDAEVFQRINFLIMDKQCEREAEVKNTADKNSSKLCVFDRGILDPVCYLRISAGEEVASKAMNRDRISSLIQSLKNEKESLVFVMKPYQKYLHNDNVRIDTFDFGELLNYDREMRSLMKLLNVKFRYIEDDDLLKRAKFVVGCVNKSWPGLNATLIK